MISLQSLLSSPEPKDPQDAVVASQLLKTPKIFEREARQWAVKYAGAPATTLGDGSGGSSAADREAGEQESKEESNDDEDYDGYSRALVGRFMEMGFDVHKVVEALNYVGIDRNGGEDYELEEAYYGDIAARLFGDDSQ